MKAINITDKLALVSSHWDPHVVVDYNENEVMVVKFQGEYPFHEHDTTDDFFYVLEGEMFMDIEGQPSVPIKAGELLSSLKALCIAPDPKRKSKCFSSNQKVNPLRAIQVENQHQNLTFNTAGWHGLYASPEGSLTPSGIT